MEIVKIIQNLDENLLYFVERYGTYIYSVLFFVVFAKTAFIITPFLPGDSVLFASGTLAAVGVLQLDLLAFLFLLATVSGDSQNYVIGRYFKINEKAHSFYSNKVPVVATNRTTEFIHQHGRYAVIFSRFVLLVRAFIPVICALSDYPFRRFVLYNSIGAVLWVTVWLGSGFLLGNIPIVANNLSGSLVLITVAVMLPAVIGYFRQRKKLAN